MKLKKITRLSLIAAFTVFSQAAWSIPMTGLIAGYDFEGDANDISGNNRHGAVVGASLTADRHGNAGSAYYFDGNDYIDTVQKFANTGSISLWLDTTQTTNFQFGEYGSDATAFNIHFNTSVASDGFGLYTRKNNGAILRETSNGPSIADGVWHNFVITWDTSAQEVDLFMDGALITDMYIQNFSSPNIASRTFNDWYIGAHRWNWGGATERYYTGSIDDFYIYNRVLSTSEIKQLAEVPEPTTLLLMGVGLAGVGFNRRKPKQS